MKVVAGKSILTNLITKAVWIATEKDEAMIEQGESPIHVIKLTDLTHPVIKPISREIDL